MVTGRRLMELAGLTQVMNKLTATYIAVTALCVMVQRTLKRRCPTSDGFMFEYEVLKIVRG